MCRYVLIALIVAVIVLMAVTALVVSLYGWPGLLILLASFVVLAFVLKAVGPRLFPHLLLGTITRPMRQMGKVLRGATLTVHSVTPCDPPEGMDEEDDGEPGEPRRVRDLYRDDPAEEDENEEVEDDEEPAAADLAWYWIDFTVTPRDAGSSEGRMVHRTAWNPSLLSFHLPKADRPPQPAGMPAFFEQFASPEVQMNEIEGWTGTAFEEDAEAEVFGEGRFRARVGVGRKIGTVLLMYAHFTEVGEIRIPRIDATPGREP